MVVVDVFNDVQHQNTVKATVGSFDDKLQSLRGVRRIAQVLGCVVGIPARDTSVVRQLFTK
jgi:hypothetical protein